MTAQKRAGASLGSTSKKRKVDLKGVRKHKKQEKAFQKTTIPLPKPVSRDDEDDSSLSDEDLSFFQDPGTSATFLRQLDHSGISRSKKETARLHIMHKPKRQTQVRDNLPPIVNNGEDDSEEWNSCCDDDEMISPDEASTLDEGDDASELAMSSSDDEKPYEICPRRQGKSWEDEGKIDLNIPHLPTKAPDGTIRQSTDKPTRLTKSHDVPDMDASSEESDVQSDFEEKARLEPVSTGARFGRLAIADVIATKPRAARIQCAKEQLASLCQDIISDPENSIGLLRRLHAFSLTSVTSPAYGEPIKNDPVIRQLTLLCQVTVFKDIIPGYRIRALTDKERSEKVSQAVASTRDWEQSLVTVYQSYLGTLESEIKAKSGLAATALQCICKLAAEVTHFNFRANLLSCIIARLSKKSWDDSCDLCLATVNQIFRADLTGEISLEIVRLINRMIKERHYNVQPKALSCLLSLRLKTELHLRASESKVDKGETSRNKITSKNKAAARRSQGRTTEQPHLSKRAVKILKEKKAIQREFRDAEAEVDSEERATMQTETLKLLFVIYFRILKNPVPTPLLPAALLGIAKFAHLVNIDFFKDLMAALKVLILSDTSSTNDEGECRRDLTQLKLLCIVTAFELLSGQGEALNLDLSDFVTQLYSLILPLMLVPDIERSDAPSPSTADMLFQALNVVFRPKNAGNNAPPWRSAAFAKRLLTASLSWPAKTALRAIEFVGDLVAKEGKVGALLSTEDRTADGAYRSDVDDPQLANPFGSSFWELHILRQSHPSEDVRGAAAKLASFVRNG